MPLFVNFVNIKQKKESKISNFDFLTLTIPIFFWNNFDFSCIITLIDSTKEKIKINQPVNIPHWVFYHTDRILPSFNLYNW